MSIGSEYLKNATKIFHSVKKLGDGTLAQLTEEELHWKPSLESNHIAIIVKHLHGNMVSRWTDLLTTDGEKPSRDRDGEFEGGYASREALLEAWNVGWHTVFETMAALSEDDLMKTVMIRNSPLTVIDSISRQLQHYGYHVGQIVFLGKQIKDGEWKQLSVPRGESSSL
ncbi:DUF1572 family protein [Paenibacillus agricola]|uniref:DUF1572 family protein n=1 Tax=Paenibacillus agricola TaxID=2716264 RepID=A0ABX0IYI2_9BACL|nr:DUF1572 family protein [Paenibacillus agricola]NHN28270.1 DUF1572 family protein [Paenibacillus agricola]